ncbi:hypothetical protein [Roseibium litorale]|uniref:Fe2OG dioxygenase domain-containing protein n=1 Tax=Roseibium litorale TaxID=2803841 RepID=A0ABR9CVD9_9HYPH|nr:hypothetical protein [Roseibium litorale]MBD8894116.1 hypothetical protein [Roseibium litorale]
MTEDCLVYQDFFPEKILEELIELISNSEIRKLEFFLNDSDSSPTVIMDAKEYAEDTLGLKFNFSILKWYRTSDVYRSGAYDFHIDPPEFRSIPLFLCTLSGRATLDYMDDMGVIHDVECKGNQVNLLRADLRHRVTPPIEGSKERLFFFLGWKSEVI